MDVTAANACCVCFTRAGEQRFPKSAERNAATGAIVCDVCWPAEFYVGKKNRGEADVWENRDRVERPEDWRVLDKEVVEYKRQRERVKVERQKAWDAARVIGPFEGEYRWLSNFWPCEVVLDGVAYSSTEHAYQAAKLVDSVLRERVRCEARPSDAKKLARTFECRADWQSVKFDVMLDLLRQKFRHPKLREKLLATGDRPIVELNHWGDVEWGVCKGVGANHLGRLLMQVRDAAQREDKVVL